MLLGLLVAPVPPPPPPLDPPPPTHPLRPLTGLVIGVVVEGCRKSTSFRVGGESAAEADDERGPSMVRV